MSHLVQVVIGLALTREDGLPIKHWIHPGNTTDVAVLPDAAAQLKKRYNEQITLVFDRDLSEHNVKVGWARVSLYLRPEIGRQGGKGDHLKCKR